ncbi:MULTISPECIES: type 2 lanthipeptide synthetase LanM family protein [unclassified Tolypothrix]|uniref:type 2 lanthipeptide synthetase LanM family protein n=2 Tax=unclassified Tolypothrix TaxID=2649714 RepID=UPI0005EAB19C|nr:MULTISPECIES: type 2 lanthipeptide synthetase LanM family protein [unclassified Tolypothrix]EKE96900.1 lanthionine synthetase C-like protein [Tolypothrix sp. PCC 7601]BAY89921.1 Lanthionine synthetase C-like protein [Microchaete diplosiphon NIES-3275]
MGEPFWFTLKHLLPDFIHQDAVMNKQWFQALTLDERIALLNIFNSQVSQQQINRKTAQERMQRWRKQNLFMSDADWAQRLELDGVTESEFLNILGTPMEAIGDRVSPPGWMSQIEQVFTEFANSDSHIFLPPEILKESTTGFLYAVEPLIKQGFEQLHQELQQLIQRQSELAFDADTVMEILLANVTKKLLQMLHRTMVLEINVARLQGLLNGDTPQERFQNFIANLRQPSQALALLQEYPVLTRQIKICIDHWVLFSLEFLRHLCADWSDICKLFSPENQPGVLIELQGSAGDSHRGGRSVLIAKFSSGLQIVYKPRTLAVDVHFQELLTWLNDRGTHPPFQTLKILQRDDYGWVEFVSAAGCNTKAEIERFYERQGGYLALLYALQATDFHSENLIAAGEHPILIDLEALFHPCFERVELVKSDLLAYKKMAFSVLSIGLLPQRIYGNAEYEGVDLSGLGSAQGQLTPYHALYLAGQGTDEMSLKRKRLEMPENQNRPTCNGEEINVLDYTDSLITGFTNIYRLLLNHRDDLLAENGILARFSQDYVRAIIRSTYIYSLLLTEGFHPDVLRNALDRDRHFDRLWLEVVQKPHLAQVITAERNDLWQGDIPLFTTRPNSRDLWTSSGERIADFFAESSMASVQRRFQQLDEADLTQQLWFIRASLTTLVTAKQQRQSPSYSVTEVHHSASREELLVAAQAVGDRLEALALSSEQDANWIGLQLTPQETWLLTPLNMDLYNGLSGVALFLAYLSAVTGEERYRNLAKSALNTILRQVDNNRSHVTSIGFFEGWGGIIYTLSHISMLWNQPTLLKEAQEIVKHLPELIEKDEQFDIISGAAGCIGGLIALYRCAPCDRTLAAAIQCGDRLIACAQPMQQGIAWSTKILDTAPLAGFSHGVAGIAWALLELASLTGEQRFYTTALAAIEYERSLFVAEVGNWLDLRNFTAQLMQKYDSKHSCMTAWCHGAPGIGLARLRSLPHLSDRQIRSEINTALKTTIAQGFGSNHSLCHGDLGNLELLLQASLTLNDPQWQTQVDRFATMILASINQHGWLCGVPLGVETPGLMTGLAGIGYGLLRLAAPELVPSVLVLEPPQLNSPVQTNEEYAIAFGGRFAIAPHN